MLNIRVIPCLLWRGDGLIKTVKFKNPVYVGDAINAIRIFNEKEVDELIILDVEASKKNAAPDIAFIKRIASECFMPLCYGGGIQTLQQIQEVIAAGVEKISMNSTAVKDPSFVKQAAQAFGSSTVVACIDYKKNLFGKPFVTFAGGQNKSKYSPVDFACLMEEMGAGEIVLNSIEKDGTMNGYDLEMLSAVTEKVTVPVIALGGAGKIEHFEEAVTHSRVSAVAAGSMFVFQGIHKAVLINYPSQKNLERLNAIHHHN
jgi:cyclase